LGTYTEFASIRRPFATTDGTGIVIIVVLVVAVGIPSSAPIRIGFTLGHLFHTSIKEIVFAFQTLLLDTS
jgi:hypothetical protein